MQIQVGIISVSDRATQGVYDDAGGPALKEVTAGSVSYTHLTLPTILLV